jgi:hypothetical protein
VTAISENGSLHTPVGPSGDSPVLLGPLPLPLIALPHAPRGGASPLLPTAVPSPTLPSGVPSPGEQPFATP